MRNKYLKLLIICLCLFMVYFILTNNKLINENIIYSINLWITKVFPSLFPMFIINELLIYSNFPKIISKLFSNFSNKILKISSTSLYVLIMSVISGTPSNAIILKNLIANKEISSKEASLTLTFTFFSSPLFLYTMLNPIFNNKATIKIIFIHYITNIIIIFIIRKKLEFSNTYSQLNKSSISFSKTLNNAIKKSIDTLLMILGTITFYIILSTILLNLFDFSPILNTIIKGTLEITQGLNEIYNLNIGIKLKEIIAISIISFGGLSIHSQIQNIISDTNIQYKYFLIGRILHTLLASLLILVF